MKNYYRLNRQVALLATFVLVMLNSFGQVQYSVVPSGGTAGNSNGNGADPVDDYYNSIRYQTVYTVAELTAAGIQPGTILTALAWDVTEAPGSLDQYSIKLGHTSATNSAAHDASPTTVVKNAFVYTPAVGMTDIVFDATFMWNGTSNLLVEICTGPSNPYASPYGGVTVKTGLTNSARFVRADGSGLQCGVNTNSTLTQKPYVRLTGTPPPAAPPTPTQDPAAPTCSAGTLIDLAGPPPADVTWYWQTTANGTSTATPYTGPYAVFSNGTYYARAFHTVNMVWSSTSSSITITNFPLASMPPAPIAAQNPACSATGGTTLTMPAPPAGTVYYWQGTTVNGTSMATPASAAYPVTASGTYHVSSFETATQCWSNTSSLAVTIDSYVPAVPTALETNYNICSGTVSHEIEATPPPGGPGGNYTASFGTNLVSTGSGAATFNAVLPAIPADAVITSAQVQLTNVNAVNGSWRSEIRVALNGAYTLAPTQISTLTSAGAITPDPVINLAGFPNAGGSINLLLTETYDDGGAGTNDATFGEVKIVVTYTQNPVSTLAWYDAASAGTQIGTASPFETVGTSVLPNTNNAGAYTFYAASISGGCQSATRLPVTVNVTEVLAELIPVDVTCNGADNGSFTLGAVECGTAPFLYSIDNGVTFGPIPTTLTAGTYSVIMQDAVMGESAPITVVIAEPGIPSALTVDDVNYFNTIVSWTAEGDETEWFVEYGPAGFTPGTGTVDTANATTWTIDGLSPETDYEFYVSANCGGTNGWAGPVAFSTNTGFYTYDNNCGAGFYDISGTGTNNALTDDAEVGVTLPFAFSYQGTTYTDITIGNNGGIMFGTLTGQVPFGNGAIGTAPLGLYPFWDDIGNNGAGVFYQTIGTAPNQQFIVQWNKEHLSATGNDLVFQLVLDQATNEVYFYYSDVIAGNATYDYGASATIGASGPIDVSVSQNNATFLQNNSCVHFYNALCPNPVNITTQIFSEEVFLNWSAGLYGETEWTIIYGPAGFDPAAVPSQAIDTLEGLMSADAIISGLTQLTEYDAYIYSECSADNLTSGGVLVNFTTLPNCSNPSGLSGLTLEDTLDLAWSWTETPGYTITGYNVTYGLTGFDVYSQYATEEATGTTDEFYTVDDASLIAGGLYDVYVQAVCGADTSTYVGPITLIMPLTNDAVCGAEMLAADGTVYTFNNAGATVESGESAIAPPADGSQVTTGWTNSTLNGTTWFTFVAPSTGSVRVNNTAINYNGQVAVYEGTDCADFATFTLDAANDNEIDGPSVAPNFTICGLTAGSTYYLMHDGFNGTTGNYSISIIPIVLEAGAAAAVTDICTGAAIDLFSTVDNEDAGGVWTSANNIAAVNASINGSDFTSEGLAYQVFNFEYRVTDGCAYDSIITQVHIFAPSNAGQDGVITACKNEPIDLLSGLNVNADLNGTWYDPTNTVIPSSAITTSSIPGQFNYDYIAGNGVCPNDTANVVVNVLGNCNWLDIQEEVFAGVSLYPNPSEGIVFITSDVTEAFDYTITDAKGAVIAQANDAIKGAQTNSIDLSSVETGVYFIRLSNTQAEKVFRVVIQ